MVDSHQWCKCKFKASVMLTLKPLLSHYCNHLAMSVEDNTQDTTLHHHHPKLHVHVEDRAIISVKN